jgi:putative nucleotidyltransferase with HDIG domain
MGELNMPDQLKALQSLAKSISVLYAEDDNDLRREMGIYLGHFFSDLRIFSNGEEALSSYKERKADIVITDILMPKMDGIKMLQQIKSINATQEMIITSAYTENDYFIQAIHLGIDAYILKPINHPQIIEVLDKTVQKITQAKENEEYRHRLEEMVAIKVNEHKLLEEEKIANYEQTLLGLIKMVERRDTYTAGHSQRVALYSKIIAQTIGYDTRECELIYKAGILHDIGKIATPDTILLKPGKLDTVERLLIQEHVTVGIEMLREIPMFTDMVEIIAAHHERYDGSGYPKGLNGDEIPPLARIMIVADAFDAMTTNRIYKPRKSVVEALEEIHHLARGQFDPLIVPDAIRALTGITIEESISQLPINALEEERFAYFYKDRVSGLYNQSYLDVVLLKNTYSHFYHCINILSLHHFSTFNDESGWEQGNVLLKEVANKIKTLFEGALLFRIHANDFVIMSSKHLTISEDIFNDFQLLSRHALTYSNFHLDIEKDQILTLESLEERMRHERFKRKN